MDVGRSHPLADSPESSSVPRLDDSLIVIESDSGLALDSTSVHNSYSTEWIKLFGAQNFLPNLRKCGMKGDLRSTRFRSICWKLYLQVLPEDVNNWRGAALEWRNQYTQMKDDLILNPRKGAAEDDLVLNNPLSQSLESPWNQYFVDNELRNTIKQDVVRTYPKIEFFHTESVREMMLDGLFIFAKMNAEIAYRQGMHELLAPLIFVLHCDHQAFLHAAELDSMQEVMSDMLNPEFIEHDAYAMFCRIMKTVEPWYVSKEQSPLVKSTFNFSNTPFSANKTTYDLHPSNVILSKLHRIQNQVLRLVDPKLHNYLLKMDIAPQIYGIRWLRLLFGREFPMQDLLVLWDTIFADGPDFDLVDYVFVAMLLYIREHLLCSDYPGCLHVLMRYPPAMDVHFFINMALHLRQPQVYSKPAPYSYRSAAVQAANYTKMLAAENLSDKAARWVNGITRKLNHPPPNSVLAPARPVTLTQDPHLGADLAESAVGQSKKRGSCASLPHLDTEDGSANQLRATLSSQNLAVRAASAANSQSSTPERSPVHNRLSFSKMTRKGRKAALERSLEDQVALLATRINDYEDMCRFCSGVMDLHLDTLESEMNARRISEDDQQLAAIVGLKQVRDVLKGILRPGTLMTNNNDMSLLSNGDVQQTLEPPSFGDTSPEAVKSSQNTEPEIRRRSQPEPEIGGGVSKVPAAKFCEMKEMSGGSSVGNNIDSKK